MPQSTAFAAQLGCDTTDNFVQVDEQGRSSVEGVYAAGDLSSRFRQLAMAAAQGASAAAGINSDFFAEDFA